MQARLTKVEPVKIAACILFLVVVGCNGHPSPATRPTLGAFVIDTVGLAGNDPPTTGYIRPRLATGCGTECTVDVWIGAYSKAKDSNTGSPPATPVKVAMIINTGSYETINYNLLPHSRVAYYDVEFYNNAGTAAWRLVPHLLIASDTVGLLKGSGHVNPCRHKAAKKSVADFWDCDDGEHWNTAAMGMGLSPDLIDAVIAVLKQAGVKTPAEEDPIWFSCTSGCCTALTS
jgi:hypothetical protein